MKSTEVWPLTTLRAVTALFVFLSAIQLVQADVVYSNLGAGDGYAPNSAYAVMGPTAQYPGSYDVDIEFPFVVGNLRPDLMEAAM